MPEPAQLRDSTQIVLPCETLEGLESRLDEEFTVTVVSEDDDRCRIIGSPVEITDVSEFLTRRGVVVQ
ncbi:VNG_1110C family protein [Natronococcus roseus]|uniref:VNG_1110C family protein n=1 Tax=Natronococcus roseus TaxID=1052014 RepID=UPI00374D5583